MKDAKAQRSRGTKGYNAIHGNDNEANEQSPLGDSEKSKDIVQFREWFRHQVVQQKGLLHVHTRKEPEFAHLIKRLITRRKILHYVYLQKQQREQRKRAGV